MIGNQLFIFLDKRDVDSIWNFGDTCDLVYCAL